MTDEQIIKALECCATSETKCDECPYYPDACLTDDYENIFLEDALDLIKRKNEEILKRKKQLMELKSEAIKEFAERLKEKALIDSGYEVLQLGTIDNLVEEITEEEKC